MLSSLTIFFPCFNDAGTIGKLIEQADELANKITHDYEILVIDDGSRDKSREILREMEAKYPRLQVILHPRNLGYGGALQSGFKNASKEVIFYTDGDAQYDIREIEKMIPFLGNSVDMVNGYKVSRKDSWLRIIIGRVYLWTIRHLFNIKIRDVNCDFRLIRRKVFEKMSLRCTSGAVCLEFVKKFELSGATAVDCPVSHSPRIYGKSQFFKPRPILRTGFDILKLWVRFLRHT